MVPVQVEGIYTRGLLDSGVQVTLLYQNFYDRHLRHILIQKLDDLKIWGIGTEKFPYNGYLSIQLTFESPVVGYAETFDTLAIVCTCLPGISQGSLIVGTNTNLVRCLLTPIVPAGDDLVMGEIHPALQTVH